MQKSRGFTLIELMIVVVVVAILASIAVPAYLEQSARGRRADCKEFIFRVSALQERYFTQNISFANSLDADIAMGGLDLDNLTSDSGFCMLTLATTPNGCAPGATSCTGYTLTGTMAGGDANCATLTYNNFGVKGFTGNAPDADTCWR